MSKLQHPLISVVVPAYNAETFIAATLQSIVDQTYPEIEVVVVDDGSSDGTADVATKVIGDALPVKVFRAVNGGQNAARNIGLALATGDYVKFLDHDDILPPWAISTQVELIRSTGQEIVVGGIERFAHDDASNFLSSRPREAPPASGPETEIPTLAACETLHPTFNEILIKRDLVVCAGGFNAALGTCEELNLLGRIYLQNRKATIAYQESPVVLYKRCMDWSLGAHYSARSASHVNWSLICRTDLAKEILVSKQGVDEHLRRIVLDPLYTVATFSYRNGLRGHALSALEAWRACGVQRPKLNSPIHENLHMVFGFELAERLLDAARKILRR